MSDEGGEKVMKKRVDEGSMVGSVPTASDVASEGSSVVTDTDIATEKEIPPTEQILQMAKEARRKRRLPRKYPAPPPAEAKPEEKPDVPHDKGQTIEVE